MKVIKNSGRAQLKHFDINFRDSVAYSLTFDCSIVGLPWNDILSSLGYSQEAEGSKPIFTKDNVYLQVIENTIFINMNPRKLLFDNRIRVISSILNSSWDKIGGTIKTVVAGSINSYLLEEYQDTITYQKKCINFFFKQMEGQESAIILSPSDVYFSLLDIKFEKNGDKNTLSFFVTSSLKESENNRLDNVNKVLRCFEELRKENYCAWRSVVSDKVLRVMERGGNDKRNCI